MPHKIMRLIAVLLFLFLPVGAAFAASAPAPLWQSARPICEAYGKVDQLNPKIAGDIVVFEDKRSGYSKLYAQRIGENGSLLWDKSGIPISESFGNQTEAQIIQSDNGSAIVVWQDEHNGNLDIYAQKISAAGTLLWSGKGIEISKEEKNQSFPQLTGDGAGGAIICWQDLRNNNEDIFAQRINPNGETLWSSAITSLPSTQWFPKIAGDGLGNAIIVWTDRRDGNFDIYGQKIGPKGNLSWPAEGKKIAGTSDPEEDPAVVSFANGQSAVAYRIKNNGIYLQYLEKNGNTKLGNSGKRISSTLSPSAPQIAAGKANDTVVVWSDSYAGDEDVYSQHIDSSGNLLWGNKELPIIQIRGVQEKAKVRGSDPWIVSWIDLRSGHPEIYAQKINGQGSFLWKENGLRIAKEQGSPENFDFMVDNNGETLFCFEKNKDIYAQKINNSGETAWGYTGITVNSSGGLAAQKNVRILSSGDDAYIFAFEDYRSGHPRIFLQKIGPSGKKIWGESGTSASASSGEQKNPELTTDGGGGAIVAWEDYSNPSGPRIFCQKINSSGSKTWDKNGIPLTQTSGPAEETSPKIISDNKFGAIVVFEGYHGSYNGKDVLAQRISPAGKTLWDKSGIKIATGGGDQDSPQISGSFIVVWADKRLDGKNSDIYAQRLSLSGKTLWQEDGIPVCEAPDTQRDPAILGSTISWTDKAGGSFDIYAQKLDLYGSIQWVKDGIAVCQSARTQQRPKISSELIIVWEDFRLGNWNIRAQKLDQNGGILWGEGGVPIASLPGTQYNPQINGNIVVWEDFRNEENYSIYAQKLDRLGSGIYKLNGVEIAPNGRMPQLGSSGSSFIAAWEDYRYGEPVIFAQKFRP